MPTWRDFSLHQAQAAIFTPGLQFRSGVVIASLLGEYADVFDGDPLALPIPPEAPPEVPRVELRSADARYRLRAAPARLDIFEQRISADRGVNLPEFCQLAAGVINAYLEATQAVIGRMACVITRIAEDDTPALSVARHFCRDKWLAGPLNRPEKFELHAHKRFELNGEFEINSWFRCRTATLQFAEAAEASTRDVISVQQDFNTLTEESVERDYSRDEVLRFYELAQPEFDVVLALYFPGD